jgi:hypothetical protein
LFSDDYDTSEKCRVPAWTDRVLWRKRQMAKEPIENWSAGTVKWYGRADLKQSDHRPVLGIIDVEVLDVNEPKREAVFQEALKDLGPPDGSVLLQFENVIPGDVDQIVDDHFMESLRDKLSEIGELRFVKYIHELIWVAFSNYKLALDVVDMNSIEVINFVADFTNYKKLQKITKWYKIFF